MEYYLFPDEYAKEQKVLARQYEAQKTVEMTQAVKKAEKFKRLKKLFSLFDDEDLYQKSVGSYMLTFCAEMVGILFILALLMGIGIPVYAIIATSNLKGFVLILACVGGAIGGTIAGFIAGGIGGFIYGGILGIVLFPLAYPLYRAVIPFKNKKREIKKQKREKWENKIKSPFLEEIAQHQRDTNDKIAKYQANFEPEAKRLSKNLENIDHTVEIAELAVEKFLYEINRAQRASRIKTIRANYVFMVKYDGVGGNKYYTFYNFSEHRIENISSAVKRKALAIAVVSLTEKILAEKYGKDVSGTAYQISHAYSLDDSNVKVELTYTAPNGNYTPAQQW